MNLRTSTLSLAALLAVAGLLALALLPGEAGPRAAERAVAPGGPPANAGRTGPADRGDDRDPDGGRRTAVAAELAAGEGAATTAGPDGERPLVVGRVIDAAGEPIAGARVWAGSAGRGWLALPLDLEPVQGVSDGERVQVDSGDDGRFLVREGLEPGPLRLALRAPGAAPRALDDLELPAAQTLDVGDVVLEPGATLAGRVVDRAGAPVAGVTLLAEVARGVGGARMTLPGRGVPVATSDAQGRFVTLGLTPGPWSLIADSPGHRVATLEGGGLGPGERREDLLFVLDAGDAIRGRVVDLPADLAGGVRVEGRVLDESRREHPDGDSLPRRARVALPDAQGAFVLAGLEPGVRYALGLWREADGSWSRHPSVEVVRAAAGDRGVELRYEAGAGLTLAVVDAASGAPVEDFVLWLGAERQGRRPNLRAHQDEEGRARRHHPGGAVRAEDLRVGAQGSTWVVRLAAVGYRDLERGGVRLRPGETTDLGVLRLERAPAVRVTVTDAESGEPLEGARVVVGPEDDRLRGRWFADPDQDPWQNSGLRVGLTGPDGTARVGILEGQSAALTAWAEGHVPSEPQPVPARLSGELELALALATGARLEVRVIDPGGAPLEGMRVAVLRERAPAPGASFGGRLGARNPTEREEQATDAAGWARFPHLEPGAVKVGVSERAGELDEATSEQVMLTEGRPVTLTLVAPPRGDLVGRVTEGGEPLAGADLELVREGQGRRGGWWGARDPQSSVTDPRGAFAFEGVAAGEYTLLVAHPSRVHPEEVPVRIEAGVTRLDVELPVTLVAGRVTTPDGAPVEGVRVRVRGGGDRSRNFSPMLGGLELSEDDDGDLRVDLNRPSSGTTTDGEGRWSLRGLSSDVDLGLTFTGPLVLPDTLAGLRLGPGEQRLGLDRVLASAGQLEVRLEGNLPNNLQLSLARTTEDGGIESRTQRFWGRGPQRIDSLAPGTWSVTLQVRGDGGGTDLVQETVEVVAGERRPLTLSVP